MRKNKSSKHITSYSFQILESYRQGKKVKQRVIKNLGTLRMGANTNMAMALTIFWRRINLKLTDFTEEFKASTINQIKKLLQGDPEDGKG